MLNDSKMACSSPGNSPLPSSATSSRNLVDSASAQTRTGSFPLAWPASFCHPNSRGGTGLSRLLEEPPETGSLRLILRCIRPPSGFDELLFRFLIHPDSHRHPGTAMRAVANRLPFWIENFLAAYAAIDSIFEGHFLPPKDTPAKPKAAAHGG